MLPPTEIEAAAISIVDENFGAGRDELIQAVSRAFGFSSTSAQLRTEIDAGIERLEQQGALHTKDGLLIRR